MDISVPVVLPDYIGGEMARIETEKEAYIVQYKTYVYVWIALLLLLAATIAAAKVEFSKYSVLVNLLIASVKAGLVLFFFMHLKYERWILKAMLLMVIATLTAVIALFFADVMFR
jgi:cytochrome c oxidase subunit 4